MLPGESSLVLHSDVPRARGERGERLERWPIGRVIRNNLVYVQYAVVGRVATELRCAVVLLVSISPGHRVALVRAVGQVARVQYTTKGTKAFTSRPGSGVI